MFLLTSLLNLQSRYSGNARFVECWHTQHRHILIFTKAFRYCLSQENRQFSKAQEDNQSEKNATCLSYISTSIRGTSISIRRGVDCLFLCKAFGDASCKINWALSRVFLFIYLWKRQMRGHTRHILFIVWN